MDAGCGISVTLALVIITRTSGCENQYGEQEAEEAMRPAEREA